MRTARLLIAALALLALVGCATYQADEFHQVVTYPLIFNSEIHAVDVSKVQKPDGTTERRAGTLTHSLTIGGFTRAVTYKNAVLQSKDK